MQENVKQQALQWGEGFTINSSKGWENKENITTGGAEIVLQVNHFNCTNCLNGSICLEIWKKSQILERNGFAETMPYIK